MDGYIYTYIYIYMGVNDSKKKEEKAPSKRHADHHFIEYAERVSRREVEEKRVCPIQVAADSLKSRVFLFVIFNVFFFFTYFSLSGET